VCPRGRPEAGPARNLEPGPDIRPDVRLWLCHVQGRGGGEPRDGLHAAHHRPARRAGPGLRGVDVCESPSRAVCELPARRLLVGGRGGAQRHGRRGAPSPRAGAGLFGVGADVDILSMPGSPREGAGPPAGGGKACSAAGCGARGAAAGQQRAEQRAQVRARAGRAARRLADGARRALGARVQVLCGRPRAQRGRGDLQALL